MTRVQQPLTAGLLAAGGVSAHIVPVDYKHKRVPRSSLCQETAGHAGAQQITNPAKDHSPPSVMMAEDVLLLGQ